MHIKHIMFVLIIATIIGCGSEQESLEDSIRDIALTESKFSQTPNIWIDGDNVHAIWTSTTSDTTALYYSSPTAKLSRNHQVSQGSNWFINWADYSSITSHLTNPEILITHWLQKSDLGTYDYDIMISISSDAGQTWSKGKVLHGDNIAAEHGFVSLATYDEYHFIASWLDGRNTKTPDPKTADKSMPMSLRTGLIDIRDMSITEYAIDQKVCDCCQTSIAHSVNGALVAYRDRSDGEIRDITIQRFTPEGSTIVFQSDDQWKINGCPVNGPALASSNKWDAMAWYTAADSASVYMVYGKEAAFDQKVKIDNGNPLGRVDIEVTESKAYVTWLEMNEQRADIRLKIINLEDNTIIEDKLIAYTSSERRSGFPILKLSADHAYIAYTEVLSADHTAVRLKQIEL